MNDQARNAYSFFGITTFGKVPHMPLEQDWTADVAVLGMPFDQAVGFRPGTRFGPKAIRDISVRYRLGGTQPGYWDLRTEQYKAACRIVDCGDTTVVPLDWEQCFANLTKDVRQILARKALPAVLGGDHSITLPILRAYEGAEKFALIHFDAHTDYRDEVMGMRYGHGSVIRRCCELPCVSKVYSIGIRSLRTAEQDIKDFRRRGNVVIPAWDIHDGGLDKAIAAMPTGERVYITFDIDGMDPSLAPGTGTPEVGGLTYPQARALLAAICARNAVIGFDLVEVNPNFDVGQITALLAAQIIIETIGFTRR
jgi:agmatinase